MERLTIRGTKEAKNGVTIRQILDKLAEYEDLEEQGKLPKLPCVERDKVYQIKNNAFIRELEVIYFVVFSIDEIYIKCKDYGEIIIDEINKTVFLTKPAAEQALKERKGKNK